MFEGKVIRISHERGLLISFNGSSPALGSTIVDNSGTTLGRVETVLGNINEPLVHVHPLKSGVFANDCIGKNVKIRARGKDNSRGSFRKHDDSRGSYRKQDDSRGSYRNRDDPRGSSQKRGGASQRRGTSNSQKKPFKKNTGATPNKHFKDRGLKNVFKKRNSR